MTQAATLPTAQPDQAPGALHAPTGPAAEFWVGTVLMRGVARLPAAVRAGRGLAAWGAWTFSRSLRQATHANAARLLGPTVTPRARRRLARNVIASHYDMIAETARLSRSTLPQIASRVGTIHGDEHYDAARSSGRGVVVVTAHLGSFDVGAAGLHRKAVQRGRAERVHVVFKRDPWPAFESARSRCRRILGVIESPIDDGLRTWLALRDALIQGHVVLMQGDLAVPGQRTLRLPFLGGHADFPVGPIKLAMLSGALVQPIFAPRRDDGRVDVWVEPAFEVPTPGDVSRGTERMARVIERYVRCYPDQWLMTRPACVEDQAHATQATPAGRGQL